MQIKSAISLLFVGTLSLAYTLTQGKPGVHTNTKDIVIIDRSHTASDVSAANSTIDAATSAIIQEIILHSMSLIGVNYRWGGNTPENGLDCSGFIRYVFERSAKLTLPRTSRSISQVGQKIEKEDLKPGDLVFFNTLRRQFSHVGIYLGDNRFIHAPSRGKTISIAKLDQAYWVSRYNGARRVNHETIHQKHFLADPPIKLKSKKSHYLISSKKKQASLLTRATRKKALTIRKHRRAR